MRSYRWFVDTVHTEALGGNTKETYAEYTMMHWLFTIMSIWMTFRLSKVLNIGWILTNIFFKWRSIYHLCIVRSCKILISVNLSFTLTLSGNDIWAKRSYAIYRYRVENFGNVSIASMINICKQCQWKNSDKSSYSYKI